VRRVVSSVRWRIVHFTTMRKSTTLAILLLTLALPIEATIAAPPPSSQADQYYETLPGAWGPTSADSTKTAKDAVREGKLTAATAQTLQERGPAGVAVADVIAKTAPAAVGLQGRGFGGRSSPQSRESDGESSPVSTRFPTPGKQGMGILFPLFLLGTLAMAVAFAMDRRRRSLVEPKGFQ